MWMQINVDKHYAPLCQCVSSLCCSANTKDSLHLQTGRVKFRYMRNFEDVLLFCIE